MTTESERTTLFETEAEHIARNILDDEVVLPDGRTGRVGYISVDDELQIKTKSGIYCGQLGIATYFAAMYAAFGDEAYERNARAAVDHLFEGKVAELLDTPYVGAGSGIGSTVYGLTLLGQLTGDQQYEQRAGEIVTSFSRSMLTDDRYDILLGTAGTITGLLAYYERSKDATALTRAQQCGEYLLENRYEKWGSYRIWDTSTLDDGVSTSTGMGHGIAGIAYALYRLYSHTGMERFRNAADSALGFENAFYSAYEQNWKANFGGVKHYTDRWCSGRVGIGHARLGSVAYHDSALLRRDVDRVVNGFEPNLAATDSLCHGTFGQVDLLLQLAQTSDEWTVERARKLAVEAIERRRASGHYALANEGTDGVSNPVLFLGTAGIGYVLLRLLHPETIPSVLQFE